MKRLMIATLLCVAGVTGCAAVIDPTMGDEDWGLDADGKLDTFFRPTEKGLLKQGSTLADIKEDEKFLAYDFALHGEASVTLGTAPGYRPVDVDTVIYLYRRNADGSFGRYLAKDDNGAGGVWSKLEVPELTTGNYRLLVKGRTPGVL